jgi:hypothetical protein
MRVVLEKKMMICNLTATRPTIFKNSRRFLSLIKGKYHLFFNLALIASIIVYRLKFIYSLLF